MLTFFPANFFLTKAAPAAGASKTYLRQAFLAAEKSSVRDATHRWNSQRALRRRAQKMGSQDLQREAGGRMRVESLIVRRRFSHTCQTTWRHFGARLQTSLINQTHPSAPDHQQYPRGGWMPATSASTETKYTPDFYQTKAGGRGAEEGKERSEASLSGWFLHPYPLVCDTLPSPKPSAGCTG